MNDHELQARFFANLQHLLVEGEFVSTYKFALLIALARWALENPDHDEQVPLDVGALSPHFTRLYWPQALPYLSEPSGAAAEASNLYGSERALPPGCLKQDRGAQDSRVLKQIRALQARFGTRIDNVPALELEALHRSVRSSIADMPLWKLQKLRGGKTRPFLYEKGSSGRELIFHEGIVRCLARFAPLVEEIVRAAWIRFVMRCNQELLGMPAARVERALFPGGREHLHVWRPALRAVQGDDCFYCGTAMHESEVDHFLPWSRYPRDLGHNFVLAHARCNHAKRDHLACAEHLEHWCARNRTQGAEMAAAFDAQGLPHDLPVLGRVARSLYGAAEDIGAEVWQSRGRWIPLDPSWRSTLQVG